MADQPQPRHLLLIVGLLVGFLWGAAMDMGSSPGFALWLIATVLSCAAFVIVLRGGPPVEPSSPPVEPSGRGNIRPCRHSPGC